MQVQTRVKASLHVLVAIAFVAGGLSLAAAGTLAVGKAVQKKTVAKSKATTLQTVCGFAPYVADYVVTSTPTAPNHYTLPSLALVAASTQGDLNGNGTIEICLRSGTPTAPKVYTESAKTTVNMNTWSVSAGTGSEPVRIFSDGTPEGTRWTNPTDRVLEVDNTMSNIPARDFTIDHIGFFNGVGAIVMASGGAKHLILDHDIITGHEEVALWFTGNESKATITNSQITDNKSMTGPAGILAGQFASITMEANGFYKNIGNEGTAISMNGDAHVNDTGSTFQGNVAHGNAGGFGGGAIAVFDDAFFGGTNSIFNTNKASGTAVVASSGQGGAVTIGDDANFSCTGCVFDGNTSTVAGGAISTYSTHGINLGNNTFTNNQSGNGGALNLSNSYATQHTIYLGTFQNNSAINDGGAITAMYASNPSVTPSGSIVITGTTFDSNTSGNVGGAINMPNGDLQIDGATFTGNTATAAGALIKQSQGTLTMSNTTFSGNHATSSNGGALFVSGATQPMVVSMSNMFFTANEAQGEGGAVFGQDWAAITINNSQFFGNHAVVAGGVASLNGSDADLAIQNSSVMANGALSPLVGRGGAVACSGGNQGVTIQLVNDNFENNWAEVRGGAVDTLGCDLQIDTTTFASNISLGGGALSAMSVSLFDAVITDTTFYRNTANDAGGAMFTYLGDFTLTGVTFEENTSVNDGGAVQIHTPVAFEISDSSFLANSSTSGLGGAMRIFDADLTMNQVDAFNNVAYGRGGFLAMENGSFEGSHLDVRANSSMVELRAGMSFVNTDVDLVNSIIAGNTSSVSSNGFAAGLDTGTATGPSVSVDYVTIAGNANTYAGGQVIGNGWMDHIVSAYNEGLQLSGIVTVTLDHSDLYSVPPGIGENGNWDSYQNGEGNVNTDPQFVGDGVTTNPAQSSNILNFDFHLQPTSPAVDIDASETDVDGSPADAGAYGGPNGAW